MSSQEDTNASATRESDRNSNFDQQYEPASQVSINGFDMSNSKTQNSNGFANSSNGMNQTLPDTTPSSSYNAEREPINHAVASAFNSAESSISPELIQLITQNITQNVIQHFNAHQNKQIPAAPPVQPPQPAATDHTEAFPSLSASPIIDRATVYTPPSPNRIGEENSDGESRFTMPNLPDVNANGYQTAGRENPSPRSRNSNEEALLSDSDTNSARLANQRKSSIDSEATVLERHWGKLFDESGQSTDRLTQFLRGIANYLIEEVEPRYSLVITPDKMQKYYELTSLEEHPEVCQWRHVFDDKTSSISRLLRDPGVQVEHHLLQATPSVRPDIPGLTPQGFATWSTLLIKAYPDQEHERLTKVLRLMAINHPEERKLRFPAALPRRLLPGSPDLSISTRLAEPMATHCKIKIVSRHNSTATSYTPATEPPQSPRKPNAPPAPTVEDDPDEGNTAHVSSKPVESDTQSSPRGSNNVQASNASKAPSVTSIEDNSEDIPTPQPFVERKRQPYGAPAGGGKSYDVISGDEKEARQRLEDQNDLRRTKSVSVSQRSNPPPPISVHQRPHAQSVYDMPDLAHARTAVEPSEGSSFRSRRYSGAGGQPHPFRRTRSNSASVNESGHRYHPNQRSPSISKTGFDVQNPRATAPEVNHGSYQTPGSSSQIPPTYPPPNDRYVYGSRQQNYDPRMDSRYTGGQRERSRGRDLDSVPRTSRSRHQSNAGIEGRSYYDDSHRTAQQGYQNSQNAEYGSNAYQFPPSAFRDHKER